MRKRILTLLVVYITFLFVPLASVSATNGLVCDQGVLNLNPPVESLPAYDYASDGLVQFHFKVKPNGWPFTGSTSILEYNRYNPDCSRKDTLSYTFIYANTLPLIPNLIAKAVQVGADQYNFVGINGDTNQEIPNAFGSLPPNFSGDSILAMKFYAVGNYGTGPDQSAVITPAVPIRIVIKKTPVLIVPGVLGTDILEGSDKLWANITRMVNPLNSDSFMDSLALDSNLLPIRNDLTLGDVLRRPSVFFNYTDALIKEFEGLGYTENTDLFTFPYDWRFGVSSGNVQALKDKIQQIMTQTGSQKVDIIAHSTGGLIVKKYVMDNDAPHIGKAVFVGVPNLGAPKAIKTLLQGDNFGVFGLSDDEMKKISANMPVVYDLSPSQKYYTTKGSYLKTYATSGGFGQTEDLDYNQTKQFLTDEEHLNAQAISNAENLHTLAYDNFDLRTKGVDMYNVVGCNTPTISQVMQIRTSNPGTAPFFANNTVFYNALGDETVPLESATNVPVDANKKFYALKANHGKLMTADGTRQLIAGLIASGQAPQNLSQITTDIGNCKLNGKSISIFSPLALTIKDAEGNYARVGADGSIENTIPGVAFDKYGEHTFAFIPQDIKQTATLTVNGTGTGNYTMKIADVNDNQTTQTQIFNHLPVTEVLTGVLDVTQSQAILKLDTNGDGGMDTIMQPQAILPANAGGDLLPPTTTAYLTGPHNTNNQLFSGPVSINLQAIDTAQENLDPSGVFNIQYSLDGSPYIVATAPIQVSAEGAHSISYFATDLAGNQELTKTTTFSIDSTVPEVSFIFDSTKKDLAFTAIDSNQTTIEDLGSSVKITDLAGNTTELLFKEANRKTSQAAHLTGLKYNGKTVDISDNKLTMSWSFDKISGKLLYLTILMINKSGTNVYSATYNGYNTSIATTSGTGKTSTQTVNGLANITFTTNQGKLVVSNK